MPMMSSYMMSHLITDGTRFVVESEPLNERKYQQIKVNIRSRVFDTIVTAQI
jgi:hypothetical protein